MREFRDFKLKALIKAIMSAQEELAQLFAKLQSAGQAEAEAVPNLHGNTKATNIFIENAGQNTNYEPVIIFSDRVTLSQPTNDQFALANVIHELICGMRINRLDNGKLLLHAKVKNSPYFRHVESLVKKSQTPITI